MFARTLRTAAVLKRATVPVRRMGGGHGHGHGGPVKTLPPRPELASNATLKEKIAHSMWYKRHPDYEGVEAYVRFYLPHNHNLVYAVLGFYAALVGYIIFSSKVGARKRIHELPAPEMPDYHTPIVSAGIPELSTQTEEWVKFVQEEGNLEKWILEGTGASAGAATHH